MSAPSCGAKVQNRLCGNRVKNCPRPTSSSTSARRVLRSAPRRPHHDRCRRAMATLRWRNPRPALRAPRLHARRTWPGSGAATRAPASPHASCAQREGGRTAGRDTRAVQCGRLPTMQSTMASGQSDAPLVTLTGREKGERESCGRKQAHPYAERKQGSQPKGGDRNRRPPKASRTATRHRMQARRRADHPAPLTTGGGAQVPSHRCRRPASATSASHLSSHTSLPVSATPTAAMRR